ncbi:type 1 glutamine amidotransferase [Jiangella alkaliphila]|uniref:GMP synthase (Glutamine-hydrolysing) n=1 Tax=Jiangella alkaliphila TaxID=419479 RepID=A0A1H2K8T3_9ACTN|nr:type 1 glutamine amidotransferase [Jiangella alkaliphila]SDU64973.1 GMP synthase (glutamine-hydrolysing) [Jiangella alkaliphila]
MTGVVDVVEHEPGCPLDRFGDWLESAGARMRVLRPYAGDPLPSAPGAGLIVLGGQMNAYDDGVAPWLPAVRSLLAAASGDGTPTLGICLGAQLLAVACGGRVDVGAAPGRESGVVDVRWRPEAGDDPLIGGLADPFPGPSMHADAVAELPPGAVWLASSAMYPHQAFRVGAAAWGVQFHPEVSEPTFAGWAAELPDVDAAPVVRELVDRDAEVVAAGRELAARFARIVATSPAVRH